MPQHAQLCLSNHGILDKWWYPWKLQLQIELFAVTAAANCNCRKYIIEEQNMLGLEELSSTQNKLFKLLSLKLYGHTCGILCCIFWIIVGGYDFKFEAAVRIYLRNIKLSEGYGVIIPVIYLHHSWSAHLSLQRTQNIDSSW